MRWTSRRWILLGLIPILLPSCGSRMFREPVVKLESVELAGFGLRGGTLMVGLEIQNPNPFALSTNQVQYNLAIADTEAPGDTVWMELASGAYTEPFSVGGGQTATVQVPVEFTYAGLGGAASSILRSGAFQYRARGVVELRTPLGPRAVPFERGGAVAVLGTS